MGQVPPIALSKQANIQFRLDRAGLSGLRSTGAPGLSCSINTAAQVSTTKIGLSMRRVQGPGISRVS